jgi:ribonuclease D
MYHGLGAVPENIVDSQIACAMLGQSLQLGYHHAAQWLLDVEVEKDHTRSNWLRRPLSSGQLRYAALDVVLLPMMMERMRENLQGKGRLDWLLEEVGRMALKSTEDVAPEDAWMRIGGAGGLNQAERTTLASLAEWREIIALNRNTARGFVVSDTVLLSMARKQPRSTTELERIEGLHPKSANRHSETWLKLIAESATRPPAPELPQLTGQQRICLKAMRKRVSEVANALDVDAALLASRKQLELLIHSYSDTGSIPERFTGWREEVVTNSLLEVMNA